MSALATLLAAIVLPGFAPVASGPQGGELLRGTFPGTFRDGYVYLPPGFERGARYPVVYLLHGMPGSPSEYLYGTDLPGFADDAIARRALRPFIAVIPAAGPDRRYNGEWAGPWEHALVDRIVPGVDLWLPTIPTARGRVLAGLSAGGYGAANIGMRHPELFGAVESWSGYFHPLHDGPFKHADASELAANDPTLLASDYRRTLARAGMRFFISTGPAHSHWFHPGESVSFAHELTRLRLPVTLRLFADRRGEWRAQFDAGLAWAFPAPSA